MYLHPVRYKTRSTGGLTTIATKLDENQIGPGCEIRCFYMEMKRKQDRNRNHVLNKWKKIVVNSLHQIVKTRFSEDPKEYVKASENQE